MNWYKIIKISNIENILKNINIKQENINDIINFLNNIQDTKIKGKYIAAIKEGIKSNPNFNINDLRNINIKQNYIPSQKAQELLNRYKNEKIYNWIRKELSKNNEANLKVIEENINHIIDWIKDENVDINNYKLEDAIKLSNEWTSKTFKNSGDKYSSNIVDMQFEDGFTMKKLTPEDAKVEGKKMNHCVGSYENKIKNNKVEVYSLRDRNNEPHVTIAVIFREAITELKGKSNSDPNVKYGKYIKEWLNKHPEIEYYQNERNAEIYGLEDVNQIFNRLPKGAKNNEEYILKGIKYNINLLYDISEELNNNKKFWEKAIEEKDHVLYYVPDKFKTYEICLKAVKNYGSSLKDVPKEIMFKHPNICFEAVKNKGNAISNVPENLITTELCLEAIENDPYSLSSIPNNLITKELCSKAVEKEGTTLAYVPSVLKTDDLCQEAIKDDLSNLQYTTPSFMEKNPKICSKSVKLGKTPLFLIPKVLRTYEICINAVEYDGTSILYVPKDFQTKDMFLKAVEQNGLSLRYIPDEFKTKEICIKAIQEHYDAIDFVPEGLKRDKDILSIMSKKDNF